MNGPRVSVVIPTYNAIDLLMQTLDSVFAQTFRDFEVLVVNDGSTDETAARLGPLAEAGQIRLINQANAGVGAARNHGIEEARGRYIALLDHDDLWKPAKLAMQVAFAEAHRECSLVTVPWAFSAAPEACVFSLSIVNGQGIIERPLHHAAAHTLFASSALLFEKSRAAGMRYGEDRHCIEDQQFHIGMLGRGKLGVAGGEILTVYRMHESNYSSQADYWFNGVRCLRQMDRSGAFAAYAGQDRRDLDEFLAHFSRTATARQLSAGKRGQAAKLYVHEFGHQLRAGRLKFLAAMPILLLGPRRLAKRVLG